MMAEKRFVKWFVVVGVKLFLLSLFSSGYMHDLFVPFVRYFVEHGGNPWQYFYTHPMGVEFPYNPLMLYILSFFSWIFTLFGGGGIYFQQVALKIPSLLGDFLITILLFKLFPNKIKAILIFYVASPIVLYAVYVHSQLDILPTAFLFLTFYLLKKQRLYWAALCLGCAISVKFHVAAAVPLLFIYVLRNFSLRQALTFIAIPGVIYAFFILPYMMSDGFYYMVLRNPKQMMLFDVFVNMDSLTVYLPIIVLFMTYGRFFTYKKINNDLLEAFMGIVFGLFVLLVPPAPGWYVWMVPFLSVFLIKVYSEQVNVLILYYGLSLAYLVFFIFCYRPEHGDLIFLGIPFMHKVESLRAVNLSFTILEGIGFLMMYALYRFGVRSNAIYKKRTALVIGIGGDSGAGKSTLMGDVKGLLAEKVTELEGDGDHKWQRYDEHWLQITHLNPKANYIHRQAEQILKLKRGESVARVNYDHQTGTFTDPQPIVSNDVIMLSGLHPFYLPKMRKLIDVKIYLDPDPELRIQWKLSRDAVVRGHTREKIIQQLDQRKDDTKKYIEPQRNFADMIIHYFCEKDSVVMSLNCTNLLKLKIILDSSVRLETVVHELQKNGMNFEWDYSDDLATQYIILHDQPSKKLVVLLAKSLVVNIDELVSCCTGWQDGYRGFVQLMTVLLLSEKMREQDNVEYSGSLW